MAGHLIDELNERSQEVFRKIVEAYMESGEPVGSRSLVRNLSENISPATIRNVMQDLEQLGLLASPHISAGRVPTQLGLRLFVDAVMELGNVDDIARGHIEATLGEGGDVDSMMERVGTTLSGLTQGASLVFAPRDDAPIKHIEIVSLSAEQALVVLVTADGKVENRLFTPPLGVTAAALRQAANFINSFAADCTLSELQTQIDNQIKAAQGQLDTLTAKLIKSGIAAWGDAPSHDVRQLVVRGRSKLLSDDQTAEDLDRVSALFDDLEQKRDLMQLLKLTENAQGVRVFIGSENKLFSLSGSSLVISPYINEEKKIIGAIGVIGPTRLNYGRIVPIVDFTAQMVGRVLSQGKL